MGKKQCAFEGCKALEFRTTEYCLRHKGGLSDKRKPNITGDSLNRLEGKAGIEVLLFFIGIIISLFGYSLLQVEPVSGWFEALINPIVQICGLISIVVGVLFILSPIFAKYGYRIDKLSTSEVSFSEVSFDPSTGMYYLPVEKELSEDKQASEE